MVLSNLQISVSITRHVPFTRLTAKQRTVLLHFYKKRFVLIARYPACHRPKHFIHHPLADLFIPIPTRLLREAFSRLLCEEYSRIYFHHCLYPGTHLYSRVNWGFVEIKKMPKLRIADKKGFEPRLPRLNVRQIIPVMYAIK